MAFPSRKTQLATQGGQLFSRDSGARCYGFGKPAFAACKPKYNPAEVTRLMSRFKIGCGNSRVPLSK